MVEKVIIVLTRVYKGIRKGSRCTRVFQKGCKQGQVVDGFGGALFCCVWFFDK